MSLDECLRSHEQLDRKTGRGGGGGGGEQSKGQTKYECKDQRRMRGCETSYMCVGWCVCICVCVCVCVRTFADLCGIGM